MTENVTYCDKHVSSRKCLFFVVLWILILLQRIYNLWSIHAVILSFLDVLQSFYSKFISFFGTNLLTQCPVPVAVFCLFFTSQKINIKRSPNTVKLLVGFLWAIRLPMGAEQHLGMPRGGHNSPGRARPPWRAQVGCAHLGDLPHPVFALQIPKYSETLRG